MDDRKKLMVGFGIVSGLLVVLLIVYLVSEAFRVVTGAFTVVNVLVLVMFAFIQLRDWIAARRKGLPVMDELSKKIFFRSGFGAWMIMMYTVIGFMVINVVLDETSPYYITIDRALPILVILSSLAFVSLLLVFKVRGIEN